MNEDEAPPAAEPSLEAVPAAQVLPPAAAVPTRRNQLMAAGLGTVAVVILAVVVTLMLLIRYDNLPSLLSYFS